MIRTLPVAALVLLLAAQTVRASDDPQVGATLPPYPDGMRELQGTCLSGSADYARVCDYGIAVLGTMSDDPQRDATPRHVVAQRSLGRDGDQTRWRITDVLAYPQARKDYWLQVGTCSVDGADDGNIVALVRHDADAESSRDVAWARRLDFASGRLVEIDPKRVDCRNEGYGL